MAAAAGRRFFYGGGSGERRKSDAARLGGTPRGSGGEATQLVGEVGFYTRASATGLLFPFLIYF